MRILVCVKHVPDPADPVQVTADRRVDRTTPGMLSSLDEYAVDQAVRLRRGKGDRVIALTMGPAGARAAVTRALQMGADEGVVVSDGALTGADAITTATVLAAAVRAVGDVDLVLTGMASTDAGTGVVPVLLADLLGWGRAGYARGVQLEPGRVVVQRDDPDAVRTLAAPLPAVVSVTDQAGEPSYPSFAGILAAKRRPVRQLDLAGLGLSTPAAGPVRVVAAAPAPPRPPARMVRDAGGSGAAALVELLQERAVVGVAS